MSYLRPLFFPSGKVHQNYKQYITWSFVSTIIVSAETALSTHSMLHSIGSNSDTIRTVNYIGKDIIGQIGGLFYIAKMGAKADKNPKRFLLYSNILQQSSYICMCATPMLTNYFLPIAGFSNILSNISFTGFGAINAKCIQNMSLDNNTGEIYAKIAVVNTLGSSIGLICGLGIIAAIPDHNMRLFITPVLAALRIFTYNRAIKGLI